VSPSLDSYPYFYSPTGVLDVDTPLAPQSLSTAKRYCAAAMLAVDMVMAGNINSRDDKYDRVFVMGRPPGHHAGPSGYV
jgi:acetoin utilization deacetylase AcuC-like enzyme